MDGNNLNYLDKDGLIFYDQEQKKRLEKKVDKVEGMGLSHNDLTDELKQKILDAGTGSFTGNYDDLMGIPTLDGTQIKGTLTKKELDIASDYDLLQLKGDVANNMADIEEMQRDYASKEWVNQQDYQNESEVQGLIDNALEGITGIDFQVVDRLPEIGEKGVIYLVSNNGINPNVYDEYIWLSDTEEFEKIGTTEVDLSDYLKKADLKPITNEEIQEILKR